jgi:hypothetical protein
MLATLLLAARLAHAEDDPALGEAVRASSALLQVRASMMGLEAVSFRTLRLSAQPTREGCEEASGPQRHGVALVEGWFRPVVENPSSSATTAVIVLHEGSKRSVIAVEDLAPGRTDWGCLRPRTSGGWRRRRGSAASTGRGYRSAPAEVLGVG